MCEGVFCVEKGWLAGLLGLVQWKSDRLIVSSMENDFLRTLVFLIQFCSSIKHVRN